MICRVLSGETGACPDIEFTVQEGGFRDGGPKALVKLNNGAQMPNFGFGTAASGLLENSERTAQSVREAIEVGYRLFDTTERYGNEEGVGQAVRESGIDRSEVFITTKFNLPWHGRDLVRGAFVASAKRLGMDYVDMLIIHWPNPKEDRFVDAGLGMVDLLREGSVRAIGMSNFNRRTCSGY